MGNYSSSDKKAGEAGANAVPEEKQEPGIPQLTVSTTTKQNTSEVGETPIDATNYRLNCTAEAQFDSCTNERCPDFYGLITLEAPRYEKLDRPGIDCVCVLDVSGSMQGQKISLVRKSMRRLVRNLGPKDRVCFITFDTYVRVIMEFTTMDEAGKAGARNLVGKLSEGSSTNLCGGLVKGLEKIKQELQNEVAAVLLFTDGQANVGTQNTEGILKEAAEVVAKSEGDPTKWSVSDVLKWLQRKGLHQYNDAFRSNSIDGMMLVNDIDTEMLIGDLKVKKLHIPKFERELAKLRQLMEGAGEGSTTTTQTPITLNTFGFGADHNNELLEKLASRFDGMYYYMENEDSIVAGFASCLGGMLSTVGQNINMTLKPAKGVADFKVHKDDNVTQNSNGSFSAHFGDIQSEEKRHVLVSMTLPKCKKQSDFKMFDCKVEFRNLVRNCEDIIAIVGTVNRTGKQGKINMEVDISKNRVLAASAISKAEEMGENNNLEGARKIIKDAKAEIMASPSANDEFCKNLCNDLGKALEGLTSYNTFLNVGQGYMMQNAVCWTQERTAQFDMNYATQMDYMNAEREEVLEQFQRDDSMDSHCALSPSQSPQNRWRLSSRSPSPQNNLYMPFDNNLNSNMLQQIPQFQDYQVGLQTPILRGNRSLSPPYNRGGANFGNRERSLSPVVSDDDSDDFLEQRSINK